MSPFNVSSHRAVTPFSHPFLQARWPRAFAHRGWHTGELTGMENSLSAFRRAAAEGYRYIETDVHASADGVAVIQHDPDLDRMTDTNGSIRDMSWRRIRAALIAGREPVCNLDEVLEDLPSALLNIDVKSDAAVPPVLRAIRRHDAWDRVCLASFDDRRLRMLRRHGDQRVLTSTGQRAVSWLWAVSRIATSLPAGHRYLGRVLPGGAAQVPPVHRNTTVTDPRFVTAAHHCGMEVHAWTVDTAEQMHDLLDRGLDGIITDRPDVLRDVLRSRGQWHDGDAV